MLRQLQIAPSIARVRAAHRHYATLKHIGCKRSRGLISQSVLFDDAPPLRIRSGRPSHGIARRFSSLTTTSITRSNNELSFARFVSSNAPPPTPQRHSEQEGIERGGEGRERSDNLHKLSEKIVSHFSDLALRNNDYARSNLEQYGNDHYPLERLLESKAIQKYTSGDPSAAIQQAIEYIRENPSALLPPEESAMQLQIEQSARGEMIVRRYPPFSYTDSIKRSYKKMMVIEGLPEDRQKMRQMKIQARLRQLLTDGGFLEIAQWTQNHMHGSPMLTTNIEFELEEGATAAWGVLERAISTESGGTIDLHGGHPEIALEVHKLHSDEESKSYQLYIKGETDTIPLIARSIAIPEETLHQPQQNALSTAEEPRVIEAPTESELLRNKRHAQYKLWEAEGSPSLAEFVHAMNELFDEHRTLPPPSQEWLREQVSRRKRSQHQIYTEKDIEMRQNLFRDVESLLSFVRSSVDEGKIRALGGKDGYAISDSLGKAMLICSETPVEPSEEEHGDTSESSAANLSPYRTCRDVLAILRSINVDIHPSHYSYAIRAACHESRWHEASKLFMGQIDGRDSGGSGGFTPIDAELGWDRPLEMGLYAVARSLIEGSDDRRSNPSKQVLDTAMKMCMISPSSQENYILAAGSALGRAGHWRDCVEYATQPASISTYGPSIAAAAMLACIENGRYYHAIEAYDFFMSGNRGTASDWQWGGGNITAVKPMCRDLLLHAMGNIRKGGFGSEAIRLFREIIDEDTPFSRDALIGIAHCLEHDGDWNSSVEFLRGYMDRFHCKKNPNYRTVSHALEISANADRALNVLGQNELLANITASVMRACNGEGQYGLSMLLCSIANDSLASERPAAHGWLHATEIVKAIASQEILSANRNILYACTQSLFGLGCESIAGEILDKFDAVSVPSRPKRKEAPHAESWINAFADASRVIYAMHAIRSEGAPISQDSRMLFERGLRRAMEHCNDANQPAAALYLYEHVSAILSEKEDTSVADRVRTFFGITEDSYGGASASGAIFQQKEDDTIDLTSLRLSDSLLAAIIKAYTKLGQPQRARSAFENGALRLDDVSAMPQSTNNFLEASLDIDMDDSISFLDAMDVNFVNPATYSVMARRYARNESWPEVGVVYNKARLAGCVSEDLGLTTMQAASNSVIEEGKIKIVRGIVDDISDLVGISSNSWIRSRYWGIKKNIGFHYARLLMRWNEPATSQKEELLFAVNEIRQCAIEGIAAKNAPLMCIVSIAQVYGADGQKFASERQRRSAVNLVLEACERAKESGFIKNNAFTANAAKGLRSLKANKECIQLVRMMISEDKHFNHRITMEQGMQSALEEYDQDSLQFFTDAFERAGYDPSRMSAFSNEQTEFNPSERY